MNERILHLCRSSGLFHLSERLFRHRLPIFCFHGFQLEDECLFRPKLFLSEKVLRERLEWLRRRNYKVLPLDEALASLAQGKLPARAIALTIDDGFFSVLKVCAPILREFDYPATLYQTSYYAAKQTPIFRLVVQYMFWKSKAERYSLADLEIGLDEPIMSDNHPVVTSAMMKIIEYGEAKLDEGGRVDLSARLGAVLDVSYDSIVESRKLSLLTAEEISTLPDYGVDVQLHTHRHRFPEDDEQATREIDDNRKYLESIATNSLEHFCYPSGEWSKHHWPLLQRSGVRSATTCDPGLNARDTEPLGLYRVLDDEQLSMLTVEAELTGFKDMIRVLSGRRAAMDKARIG